MKVFGFMLSPFVRKVHLVAAEKGIAVEMAPANMRNPSPEFAAASPFRKIPALQDGDYTLADSTAIVTYLDALQPEPPLFPADARARGKAIWWEEYADTILTPTGAKILFNRFVAPKIVGIPGDEAVAAQGDIEIQPLIAHLESQVPDEGWLVGEFSIADIAIASVLRSLAYAEWQVDPQHSPRAAAWYARMCQRPAWQSVATLEDAHSKAMT